MLLAYIYRSITHRVHFLDKASRDLFICAKDLFVEAMAAHTHGPMPARSALKGRGSSSDGDARGVAGAVHADALQQWRQTAS